MAAGDITQDGRSLRIETPLGADALILTGLDGEEPMSRLFRYRLDVMSDQTDLNPADLLGKKISFSIHQRAKDTEPRVFSGIVSQVTAGSTVRRGYRDFRLEVVPWTWFLTLRTNSRIFQNKTAKDIIQTILGDVEGAAFDVSGIHGTLETREYCVQYRETDFDFISRLMEEEGIFYFFKHSDSEHKMFMADDPTGYYQGDVTDVEFEASGNFDSAINAWSAAFTAQPAKWVQRDYNFTTPQDTLETNSATKLKLTGFDKAERFDYPGLYLKKSPGTTITTNRMEHDEAEYHVVSGASTCRFFSTGAKFTLSKHDVESEVNKSYVLTSVNHQATDLTQFSAGAVPSYGNSFTCIPDQVPNRPPRVTPKPTVKGLQTALVVGPSGEEIYTDKYGRIKVQFFWDREGQKDDKSSIFIRVSQSWAHKQWGAQFIPRIGQEVVIDFLEGDPDRPLVTGAVYNEDNMPPYALPTNKYHSGIKTRSEKGGESDFNELRFEDNKAAELVYFHAQKDFKRVVEHDDDLKVGNDQTIVIEQNRTETVNKGNETVTISTGNRKVEITKGDESLKVGMGNRDTVITMGNDSLKLDMGNRETVLKLGNDTTKLNLGKSETEAMQSIELKVGASSLKVDQMGVTIKGMMIKIEGTVMTEVKGLMTKVDGSAMLMVKGAITMIG